MSVRILLNNSIRDLTHSLNNNDVMYQIVQNLMGRLNTTNIVKPTHKDYVYKYLEKFPSASSQTTLKPVEMSAIQQSSPTDLLLIAMIYYLSDLNKYDFHLINYVMDRSMSIEDVIVLLLLNDIHSIDKFCQMKGLLGSPYYTITTLKKLSALHRVEWNF
jgi:hypothetical protein